MVPPDITLWPLEPHTKGKHLVLRSYLDAWLPILGTWNGRILFVDGFAGPGEYENGEEGSPQIAMRALVDHSARSAINAEIGFIFIEKRTDRAEYLSDIVERWRRTLPDKCWANVVNGEFDESLSDVLDALDDQSAKLAPTFLMIDPFGVSGTPMNVVARVLRNPKCEIYASLMYEPINRFCETTEFAPHLDDLFGSQDWRVCATIDDSGERRDCFFELYESQLRASGAKYIVHFDLYEGNRFIYSIFFATQHLLGCDRMKAAIWRLAPGGDYEFRGTHSTQLTLGLNNPDFAPFKQALQDTFKGKGWVSIEQLVRFVQSDQIDYFSSHLKRKALVPLENECLIEIDEGSRTRKRTFPEGCKVRFV